MITPTGPEIPKSSSQTEIPKNVSIEDISSQGTTKMGGSLSTPESPVPLEQRGKDIARLSVSKIDEKGKKDVKKVAETWYNLAKKDWKGPNPESQILQDCLGTYAVLHDKTDLNENDVVVCKNETNEIQAIALYNKKEQTLEYLGVHPKHINPDKPEENDLHGAKSAIMLYFIEEAKKKNEAINLVALSTEVPFYGKFQFEQISEPVQPEDLGVPMTLTKEKIQTWVFSPPYK